MSLNIKNPEAHELAAEPARLTGESVTEAIRDRLKREKMKRDEDRLFAELMEIAEQRAAYPRRDDRSLEEFLYDERGLPHRWSSTAPRSSRSCARSPKRLGSRAPSCAIPCA